MGFYGPPTLGINCHEGGKGGGLGKGEGVVNVKEEEKSDRVGVMYEVIQDSIHGCHRGVEDSAMLKRKGGKS